MTEIKGFGTAQTVAAAFRRRVVTMKLQPDSPWIELTLHPEVGGEVGTLAAEKIELAVWRSTAELYYVNDDGAVDDDPLDWTFDSELAKVILARAEPDKETP
jgi:hypothetical protein